jgi:hypothetical protein
VVTWQCGSVAVAVWQWVVAVAVDGTDGSGTSGRVAEWHKWQWQFGSDSGRVAIWQWQSGSGTVAK